MVLFFQYEAVLVSKTASENRRLWQLGEAWVFDQMTSDQASGGLKHENYHHLHSEQNSLQMTRPIHLVYHGLDFIVNDKEIALLWLIENYH